MGTFGFNCTVENCYVKYGEFYFWPALSIVNESYNNLRDEQKYELSFKLEFLTWRYAITFYED